MSNHTPGPWEWLDYPDGRKLLMAPDRAVIHCPDAPMGVAAADARLLAAAPDLYEACRAALELMRDMDLGHLLVFDQVAAAIDKAEGNEPEDADA